MYWLLFANGFSHVLGSRSYVSCLLIDTRVVALLGSRKRRDLISCEVDNDLMGRQTPPLGHVNMPCRSAGGRNISVPCFAIYRKLLWIAALPLDADSNLISWRIKRRFMSQNAPCHARHSVGERNGCLVSMHAF